MDWYLAPLFGYLVIYAVFFFGPYVAAGRIAWPRKELDRLVKKLRGEVTQAQETAALSNATLHVASLHLAQSESGDGDGTALGHGGMGFADEGALIDPDEAPALAEQRRQRVRRPERPESLRITYNHLLVDETAAYFRARYPVGDFRRFELERLPAYAGYAERLLAARNMAGLFVLFGLLGTMIKLEEVVSEIGTMAQRDTMESSVFLGQMGSIMGNTGGAFLASIYGLALMVGVLVLVGLIDRLIQRHAGHLDHDVQAQLVPALVDLHEAQNPNVSVSDLIAETGALLSGLNQNVGGLTAGMNESLVGLSDRIEKMLSEFDAFSTQYTKLSDLLETLKSSSKNMAGVTHAIDRTARSLDRAGERLRQPIDSFNVELNTTLREHLTTIVEAMERARLAQTELGQQIHEMQAGVVKVSEGLRDDLGEYLDQNRVHNEAIGEAVRAQIDLFEEQRERVERELKQLAEAMKAADSEKMSRTIRELNEQVGGSAALLQRSAKELERAAQALRANDGSTLFGWARQQVHRLQR
jgi:methyl-accepting chemotaxis protein